MMVGPNGSKRRQCRYTGPQNQLYHQSKQGFRNWVLKMGNPKILGTSTFFLRILTKIYSYYNHKQVFP